MRPENMRMKNFLEKNGIIDVHVKYIWRGSLRGSWRICRKNKNPENAMRGGYLPWTEEDAKTMNNLGFRERFCSNNNLLTARSGNGGMWHIFVTGHHGMEVEG